MNRFSWQSEVLHPGENKLYEQGGVRLYDGDNKTSFDNGYCMLTTHRLFWKDKADPKCVFGLPLALVVYSENISEGFKKSAKVVLHLQSVSADYPKGPVSYSPFHSIKLSFRDGGQVEFSRNLDDALGRKLWEFSAAKPKANETKFRSGIVGFERKLDHQHKQTAGHIDQAFEDMQNLMKKAKEMVDISHVISDKIRNKQGDITDDETLQFKSHLLSLGISDPITRETHGAGNKYFIELARQIASVMLTPVQEAGGMMTLTDIYCRLNRARGIELLSPSDLQNACLLMERLQLPLVLRKFDSGVIVLMLATQNEERVAADTAKIVDQCNSLTGTELAQKVGLSVIIARERLITAENLGLLCRDDSVEGLRFYPNLFASRA